MKKDGMDFYDTPVDEQEVTVCIDRRTMIAKICSTWPGRTVKLARRYGKPIRVSTRDGQITSAFFEVPAVCISFRSPNAPKPTWNASDEESDEQ